VVAKDELWEMALDQHGFVTTADARDLDLPTHTLCCLVGAESLSVAATASTGLFGFP